MPFLPLKTLIHKALRGIRLPSNCRTRVSVYLSHVLHSKLQIRCTICWSDARHLCHRTAGAVLFHCEKLMDIHL